MNRGSDYSLGVHAFDTEPLAGLPRLRALRLEGFEEPSLRGLPPSMRVLRMLGGTQNVDLFWDKNPPRNMFATLPEPCR